MSKAYPEAKAYIGKAGGDKKSISVTENDFSWLMLEQETGRG